MSDRTTPPGAFPIPVGTDGSPAEAGAAQTGDDRAPAGGSGYELRFNAESAREWKALDRSVREPFRRRLRERLAGPRVASSALRGMGDAFKIKLRAVGYRLVYVVDDAARTVTVVAVGRRDSVYGTVRRRLP